MSKGKILVTDSLFIFDEHVKQLEDAGYEVERLDKPQASEEELIKAVKGKVGYILGGIERVTPSVIEAGDELKAIVFTGADWAGFIPGHELATEKGISIANAPGANSTAVAEYTITLMLMMLRRALELGSTGDKTFMTTDSVSDVQIGIIGMGRIAQKVVAMLQGLGAANIVYWNRTRRLDLESQLDINYMELEDLLRTSDVISNHVASSAGELLGEKELAMLHDGALVINTGAHNTINKDALYKLLKAGCIRAAVDDKTDESRYKELPLNCWFSSNENTGYNTHSANKLGSDMATDSILNLLKNGEDKNKVN